MAWYDFVAAGVTDAYFYTVDSDGYITGSDGVAPANGNATGKGPRRLYGIKTAPTLVLSPNAVPATGDNGVRATFVFKSQEANAVEMTFMDIDLQSIATLQSTLVDTTSGPTDMTLGLDQPTNPVWVNAAMMFSSDVVSKDSATDGAAGWRTQWVGRCIIAPAGTEDATEQTPYAQKYMVIANSATRGLTSVPLTNVTNGDTSSIAQTVRTTYKIMVWCWRGDGTTAVFNLPTAYPLYAASSTYFSIAVEGVKKTITTNYTLTTTAVTFEAGHIPAAGERIQAVIIGSW